MACLGNDVIRKVHEVIVNARLSADALRRTLPPRIAGQLTSSGPEGTQVLVNLHELDSMFYEDGSCPLDTYLRSAAAELAGRLEWGLLKDAHDHLRHRLRYRVWLPELERPSVHAPPPVEIQARPRRTIVPAGAGGIAASALGVVAVTGIVIVAIVGSPAWMALVAPAPSGPGSSRASGNAAPPPDPTTPRRREPTPEVPAPVPTAGACAVVVASGIWEGTSADYPFSKVVGSFRSPGFEKVEIYDVGTGKDRKVVAVTPSGDVQRTAEAPEKNGLQKGLFIHCDAATINDYRAAGRRLR